MVAESKELGFPMSGGSGQPPSPRPPELQIGMTALVELVQTTQAAVLF